MVKKSLIVLILLIAAALPAMAQEQPSFRQFQDSRVDAMYMSSRLALYGSTAGDLATTWNGLSHGRYEANPVLGQSRFRQGAISIGSVVAVDFLTSRLRKSGHRKLATILNFVVAGQHSYAAARNGW